MNLFHILKKIILNIVLNNFKNKIKYFLPIIDKTINAIIPNKTKTIKHITNLSVYKFLAKYFKNF